MKFPSYNFFVKIHFYGLSLLFVILLIYFLVDGDTFKKKRRKENELFVRENNLDKKKVKTIQSHDNYRMS